MPVRTSDIIRDRLIELHDTKMLSFRDMASLDDYRGIPAGTLCSIYHGADIPERHRAALGLAPLVKTEACPACGVVHTKGCPRQVRRRRPRLAIAKDNPASAAASITRNCSPEFVRALLEELRDGGR